MAGAAADRSSPIAVTVTPKAVRAAPAATMRPTGAAARDRRMWVESYAAMATTYALPWSTLSAVTSAARAFLQPVLDGTAAHQWSPVEWRWE